MTDALAEGPGQGDPDAALVAQFLPPQQRGAGAALLGLRNTLLDSLLASEEPGVCQMRLSWWAQALQGCEQGNASQHPLLQRLQASSSTINWSAWQVACQGLLALSDPMAPVNEEASIENAGAALWFAVANTRRQDDALAESGARWLKLMLLRRDRFQLRWLSLSDLARFQCQRRQVRAAYEGGDVPDEVVALISEQVARLLGSTRPISHWRADVLAQPGGGACAIQDSLDQHWLTAMKRRPLAILAGHRLPFLPGRLWCCWRAGHALQRQRRHGGDTLPT